MGLVIGDKVVAGAVIGDKKVGGMVTENKVIFRVGVAPPPPVTPNAAAPNISIGSVQSVSELAGTLALSATISGGTYDTISYAWEVVSGGGSILGSDLGAIYTIPNVTADTTVTVRITATATGTGTNAVDGTSDTSTDTEVFTVLTIADFIQFPAGTYAGFCFRVGTGSLCAYDSVNTKIVRRTRGGTAQSDINLSNIPAGVTYNDMSVDSAGQFYLWRHVSSGNAVVDRYSSTGAFAATITMTGAGGDRFAFDFHGAHFISMDGSTLRVWESDGTMIQEHTIGTRPEEDVIVDFLIGVATHAWFVSDGRRVQFSNGATDAGMASSWPTAGAPGTTWQFGYEDPTAGGSIWLFRSDALAYRVGSGAPRPGTPLTQSQVVQRFRDAGLAVYAGTMGAREARSGNGRFILWQADGTLGSVDAQHNIADTPILSQVQWFGDLDRLVMNNSNNADVNFETWVQQAANRVYIVRISSGNNNVNEYLCIGPATNGGGGQGWLNMTQNSGDSLRVASDSKHGSIEGTVMALGDDPIPAQLDNDWLTWMEAEWDVDTAGRQFVIAFGASDTPIPLAH